MDISVIIPTLNEENNIKSCLDSIISQETKLSYEIIVCDGMSKNKTFEIAEKYGDKVIISKLNFLTQTFINHSNISNNLNKVKL